jgi:hypothetical protein
MKKFAFILGFGLLPLWVATVVVFLGGLLPSRSSEYWAVAPWLVIASIPVCGVSLFIALATLTRHALASGDRTQKYGAARSLFWSLTLLAGVIVGALWLRHEYRQHDFKLEEGLAIEFVKSHALVIQKGGGGSSPSMVAITKNHDGVPVKYEIGMRLGYAIVSVVQLSGHREFNLDCITTLSLGERDPTRSPCDQDSASTKALKEP